MTKYYNPGFYALAYSLPSSHPDTLTKKYETTTLKSPIFDFGYHPTDEPPSTPSEISEIDDVKYEAGDVKYDDVNEGHDVKYGDVSESDDVKFGDVVESGDVKYDGVRDAASDVTSKKRNVFFYSQCMVFWYNMRAGDGAQSLDVLMKEEGNVTKLKWHLEGDQGGKWKKGSVSFDFTVVYRSSYRVLLRATRGSNKGMLY